MPDQRISTEQVEHIAKLARLSPSSQQLQTYATQLEAILDYVAVIGQADVSGVEPMAHAAELSNVLRDDHVGPTLSVEAVLQNAPDTDGPFFKVPKVIGGSDEEGG